MRAAGADGYAVYEVDPSGTPVLGCSFGAITPETAVFPLRVQGRLNGRVIFAFSEEMITEEAKAVLGKMAGVIEAVWNLKHVAEVPTRLATRIAELEAELADAKIADRAQGVLADDSESPGTIEAVIRHVESVLRPSQLNAILEGLLQKAEREIAERQLTARAKIVLQSVHGMSEEQAHAHLRVTSRNTRRPIREVARELIDAQLIDKRIARPR